MRTAATRSSRCPGAHTVLARPRLFEMLSSPSAITLVRAPAGFETRTLLTSWLRNEPDRAQAVPIWVPPPTQRMSPDSYWRSALQAIYDTGLALPPPAPELGTTILQTLTSVTSTLRTRCVLLLDFFDTVPEPTSSISATISRLVQLNSKMSIVVVAPANLFETDSFARLSGTHIGPEQLMFTPAETAQLCQAAGITDPDVMAERIHMVCSGIPRWTRRVIEFASAHSTAPVDAHGRPRAELTTVIAADLERMFEDSELTTRRTRMLALAPARTISTDLATELIPGPSAADDTLDCARRAGLVVRADSTDGVLHYRFPEVVRDALLELVRTHAPGHIESVSTFLARRALELENHAAAAQYAADAQNWPLAMDIIEEHWATMVTHHFPLLRLLLDTVPETFLHNRPSIKAGRAVFVGMLAHAPALAPGLPRSDADLHALASDPSVATAIHVATVQSIGLRVAGRYDEAAVLTRRVLVLAAGAVDKQPHLVHAQLPILRLQWALTFQLAGADGECVTEFMQAYRGAVADNVEFVARNSAGNLALLWALAGHQPRARTWSTRETNFGEGGSLLSPMVRVGGLVATALTRLDGLDTGGAKAALDELGEPSHREELWAYVAYAQAHYALLVGVARTAEAAVRRLATERVVQRSPSSFARVLITAARVDLHLALGQGNHAAAIVAETPLDHPMLVLAGARVSLFTGHPDEAVASATRALTSDDGSPRVQIEALLVLAAAYQSLEVSDSAVQSWRTACALADESGCYRPFTTVGVRLRRTLADASGTGPAVEIDTAVFPDTAQWVQLSARERLVLACLARGLSTQQIAEELFVSLNTVKTQARTLYRKLGAHSKSEALTIAHTLRLLDSPPD